MKGFSLPKNKIFNILDTIVSTLDIDKILTTVVLEIQAILGADRCTLYLLDKEKAELYSRVLQADTLVEIRVPLIKESLAGFSAITGRILKVTDVYDDAELKRLAPDLHFDKKWDEKSGYMTRSLLVMPIYPKTEGNIIGVFQALNKPGGFSRADINTMKQLAYLLGIAINNALFHQALNEEKILREYIIDNVEEGICILDTKKRILSANSFLEIMSGRKYSATTMTGKNLFEIFPNFRNTQLEEKVEAALLNGFNMIALLEVLYVKIIPYLDEKAEVKRLVLIFARI